MTETIKNHMQAFTLKEISFVRQGMQAEALAEILKSKEVAMSDSQNETAQATAPAETTAVAATPTAAPVEETPATIAASTEETKEEQATAETATAATVEKMQQQVNAMDARFSKFLSISALSDVEKTHYDGLHETDQDVFLAKTTEQRAAEIAEKAVADQVEDPVVFTGVDGITVLKSQGPEFLQMAKNLDALTRKSARLEQERIDETFRKRAEDEFGHLPGDVQTRVNILKAVDTITDASAKEQALQLLKAKAESFAQMEGVLGTSGATYEKESISSAHDQLEKMARDHQIQHPEKTYAKAYQEMTRTARGQELLQQHYQDQYREQG